MIDSNFISNLNDSKQDLESTYRKYAEYFGKMAYLDTFFRKYDIEKTIGDVKSLLSFANNEYLEKFEKMLNEENCDNPYIIIYDSQSSILQNESQCFAFCITFFKTDTIADISLLLHEFTHYLVNENNKKIKPFERETLPVLSEFLVYDYTKDNNFLKSRLNTVIYDSKSLLCKLAYLSGNKNINKLFEKYNFTENDIKMFKRDFFVNENLSYDGEIKYINGFVNALLLSNENAYNHYFNLIEDISNIDIYLKENASTSKKEKTLTKNLKTLKNML